MYARSRVAGRTVPGERASLRSLLALGERASLRSLMALGCLALVSACASVEKGRYGVTEFRVQGTRDMNRRAVEACLITRERENFSLVLGLGEPTCGQPSFTSAPPTVRLWRWPWTEWPSLNHAVLDRDIERILRWYRARGYYQAKVVDIEYDPPEAASPGGLGECDPEADSCKVSVLVTIEEGEPTRIAAIEIRGADELEVEVRERLAKVIELREGERIDEVEYERDKEALEEFLRKRGYASAEVKGTVEIDSGALSARVVFHLRPGPACSFGELRVTGAGELPTAPIISAVGLARGRKYDPAVLAEIQAEVFALGAFSAVDVREEVSGDVVDVIVEVTPLGPHAFRTGVGILSGNPQRVDTTDQTSIPQWDVHLFGRYERRHVFGTLGRFSIDERPRLIFLGPFPIIPNRPDGSLAAQPGNIITVNLNQPGLVEHRTDLRETVGWDYGPDPYLNFIRSDVFFRVAARRGFFSRKLVGTLAVQQDLYIVPEQDWVPPEGVTDPMASSYEYLYVEQDLRLDLRDNPIRPRRGFYAALNATQAPKWAASDWTSFRIAPELRFYLPLPLGVVLATKVALASIFITDADGELDDESQRLGPLVYRLRGGGPNGNRGFLAGGVGPGPTGGIRRWEASAELRIPLGRDFVLAGFVDIGDVNEDPEFRFDYWNMSLGPGLRFYTVLGAIRLDTGFRIPSLQRLNEPGYDIGSESHPTYFFNSNVPGAFQLTIGDAF